MRYDFVNFWRSGLFTCIGVTKSVKLHNCTKFIQYFNIYTLQLRRSRREFQYEPFITEIGGGKPRKELRKGLENRPASTDLGGDAPIAPRCAVSSAAGYVALASCIASCVVCRRVPHSRVWNRLCGQQCSERLRGYCVPARPLREVLPVQLRDWCLRSCSAICVLLQPET